DLGLEARLRLPAWAQHVAIALEVELAFGAADSGGADRRAKAGVGDDDAALDRIEEQRALRNQRVEDALARLRTVDHRRVEALAEHLAQLLALRTLGRLELLARDLRIADRGDRSVVGEELVVRSEE